VVETDRIVARYVLSKVSPLNIDQDRLKRWFGHILRNDKILDDIIVSGTKDEMVVRVNSEKRGHSVFKLRFDITPDLTGIRITPKITAIG
jgi:hypothetical protein